MTEDRSVLRLAVPRDPELRVRLYRALALELMSATAPAVVLVEAAARTTDPPIVTVSPGDLVTSALAGPAFASFRKRLGRVEPTNSAVDPRRTLTWTLRPRARFPAASTGPGGWDPPDREALLGPCGDLEVQTYWLAGRSDGRVWAGRRARFRAPTDREVELRGRAVARFVAADWSRACGVLSTAERSPLAGRDWPDGSTRSWPSNAWVAVPSALAERLAEPSWNGGPTAGVVHEGHSVALGASGAGKTTFLADAAVRAIGRGAAVLTVDLHGDLAPAIAERLSPSLRSRLVAIDAGSRPVVGVAALAGRGDREAAQLVAAVKRLSPDGTDVYWGFRLERIFDAFVRLVQGTGGGLADLYALLTDANRREAARLATTSPELARFLDELAPIVRCNPEFLWSAAARLAKVVLVPELAELLAPPDGGIPVEELLDTGRSVLIRLPIAAVGPEAAGFAGSLVLARSYLGIVARRESDGPHRPVVVVLDEVQGFSPKLVAEMLTESRKFGVRVVVASQYPERLAGELRHAVAGVSRTVVAFRVPRANADDVGRWLGLAPGDAQRILPDLPVGVGVARTTGTGDLRTVAPGRGPLGSDHRTWPEAVARTREEFPPDAPCELAERDEATDRLLLAVLAGEEQGCPVAAAELVDRAITLPGETPDRALLEDRAERLARSGLAREVEGRWHLSPVGERRLGLLTTTGASRESAEHRTLLLRCFRLFARRGLRLEIVRQGRYDTTLPDAILRQLPELARRDSPRELAAALARVEPTWAWRFFGGRDVHVEAEVSGALRPARIRHGLTKAAARGAFALFVVADASKAARVRRALHAQGVVPRDAQVWTLDSRRAEDRKGHGSSPGV